MPDETTEESQTTEQPPAITREDVEALIAERESELNEKISGLETELAAARQPVTPATDEQLVDPNWQPKTTQDLVAGVVKAVREKGVDPTLEDKLVGKVVERLQLAQQTYAEQQQKARAEADKAIDREIATVRQKDAGLKEDEVYKFIADWNTSHASKITTFTDGYELWKLQTSHTPAPSKTRIIGGSSSEGKPEPKAERFMSVDDALAAELADLQREAQ